MTGFDATTEERFVSAVASRAAARAVETRLLTDPEPAVTTAVGHAELWRHATRHAGDPIEFGVVRALRENGTLAATYRKMVRSMSFASSQMALAASSSDGASRAIEGYNLELLADSPMLPPVLVLSGEDDEVMPGEIEVFGMDGLVRVELPPSVQGHVQLVLDPGNDDHQRLRQLLTDPTTEVFLIRPH